MVSNLQGRTGRAINSVLELSDEEKIKAVVKGIRDAEKKVRARYSWLRHQNTIGLAVLLVAVAGMIGSGTAYYYGVIPAWACVCLNAFFASFCHEIEHDLIHRIYFRHRPAVYNAMMLAVWVTRPNSVNPWYRRNIHLLHHRVSGSVNDIEERLVGNGQRYGLMRFIVMFDGMAGLLLRARKMATAEEFGLFRVLASAFPFTTAHFAAWYTFLAFHGVSAASAAMGNPIAWSAEVTTVMTGINFAVVVLVGPNVLRSACLNFITSSMHYYGGVRTLMQQTQVFTPWFLWPAQLFCFNFGSTHSIHHFVVTQPFYVRQMISKKARKVLLTYGVRHNDLRTFFEQNHYEPLAGNS
jgi:fatty acid desaturase